MFSADATAEELAVLGAGRASHQRTMSPRKSTATVPDVGKPRDSGGGGFTNVSDSPRARRGSYVPKLSREIQAGRDRRCPAWPQCRLHLALACAGLLLAACGALDSSLAETPNASSPAATAATSDDASPSGSLAASVAPSVTPSSAGSAEARYVSESGGWSVAVPAGWELVAREDQAAITITRDHAIGEVYSSPSRGLGIEELLSRTVQDLSAREGGREGALG